MIEMQANSVRDLPAVICQLQTLAKIGFSKGCKVVVFSISQKSRSPGQNAKFHALITDIKKAAGGNHSLDVWKALLVDAFEQEIKAQGGSLPRPGQTAISFDGQRAVTVRPSTRDFNKSIASQFIEFIYAFGLEQGVVFSEKSERIAMDGRA